MMDAKQLIVFGFGNYGEEISKSLRPKYQDILIVDQYERHLNAALNEGFTNSVQIDVHDDQSFSKIGIKDEAIVFCAFDDESFNTFLTLSLRALYPDLKIVAIGETKESMHKLKMAGATQVIIIEETGANVIYNMLLHPTVSTFLEHILYLDHDLHIGELKIGENSELIGKKLNDTSFQEWEGITVLGLVDVELGSDFIFAHSGYNHQIDRGDTLVLLGYAKALKEIQSL
jgi:voltage-gated potassium channel